MKTTIPLVLALLLAIPLFSQDVEIEPFATGLTNPVGIENAGDDRLFVVERRGFIQVLSATGELFMDPFLDIDAIVTNNGGESGLLGLAFHPDYSTNGYFYVNYINNSGNTVVSRFTASSPTSNTADAGSELVLMTIDQPFSNHNGGHIAFGPNGYLYIGTGDGGSGGDPGDRAQNLTVPLGKLLRIDVDNTSNGNNYAIPIDNPFNGSTTLVEEIWSYGLRNPWRFSFDRDTGEIWIADVGQNAIEEINMVPLSSTALNYGWRCYEGDAAYNLADCPPASNLQFPVAQYTHNSSGAFKCSITGGFRYRGTAQPSLEGLYFFADYCSDEIGILEYDGADWNMSFTEQYSGNGWTTFGEDMNGEIYIAGISSGNVYKIIDATLSVSEEALSNIKIYPNPVSDTVIIDTSSTPEKIEHILLYDLHGKIITSIHNPTESITSISTAEIQSGFYLVEIITIDGKRKTNKLIKN